MKKKCIVLLSGGLDSLTCLAVAKDLGFEPFALSFSYGQRHSAELAAAKRICEAYDVGHHKIFNIDIAQFGGSALTDSQLDVPAERSDDIPSTYVPARNTIFLSIALAWAEVLSVNDLFIGVNALDYSGYPDCRPEYIEAYEEMANLATKHAVTTSNQFQIHTPLIDLKKKDIIRLGVSLDVDYSLSVSCYQANDAGQACGVCDSCYYRKQGFKEADIADPTHYYSPLS